LTEHRRAAENESEREGDAVPEIKRSRQSIRGSAPRRWPVLAAGAAFLLFPPTALPLPAGNLLKNPDAESGRLATSDTAVAPRKPRFGKVTFRRIAALDESGEHAQLTLSLEGRIASNGAKTFSATLQFQGTITCMSPGQCSACPGLVLTETAVGTVRSRRLSSPPFRVTRLSKTTYDLSLVGRVTVERQRTEFTGEGCNTRTINTTEVWTFDTPSAREIRGRPIKKLSGSVGRSLQAPPGGHVCGLPNGWAFTTCNETLAWKLR
jgi:hypothetical protein